MASRPRKYKRNRKPQPRLGVGKGGTSSARTGMTREEIAAKSLELQRLYLESYATCGQNRLAAKAAGVHECTPHTWCDVSRADQAEGREPPAEGWFHDRLAKAREHAIVGLEDEAVRRAKQGVSKPILYRGAPTGYSVREYSDALLMFLLKGHKPGVYRDRSSVELSGRDGGPMRHEVGLTPERIEQLKKDFLGIGQDDPEPAKKEDDK